MSRTLWFAAGAGVGLYAVTRARRAAEVLTPDGLADRLAGLSVGLRMFREEVRVGMDEKENEVRTRLVTAFPGGPAELSTARPALGVSRIDGSGHDREADD
jgi:hypothetical protein